MGNSEIRFQTLVEKTDAIILIVQDSQICYANPMFEFITGYTNEELLIQTDLFQQFQLADNQPIIDDVNRTIAQYPEIKLLTKNGEECWLNYSVKIIEFAGKPAKLVTAADITQHKQAEQRITQVLEREKELGQSRVQLVSMVSHELRVPLNVISFCTNLLKRHSYDWTKEKIQEYVNRLQKGVEMLSLLIDELLIITSDETDEFANFSALFGSCPQLKKIFNFIETHYHESISARDVAKYLGFSSAYLTGLVRNQTGETLNRWIVKRRVTAARTLLLKTDQSIQQIAMALGYRSINHFFRQFRQYYGTSPQAWRKVNSRG